MIPEFPDRGRAFSEQRLVGPGDTAASGRARVDAIVDWLQAVAYADVVDAGLDREVLWVVRRCALRIERFPVLGDRITLTTACSSLGARWAERRTRCAGIEAVALWVAIDPQTLLPARIDHLAGVYGESARQDRADASGAAAGRRVATMAVSRRGPRRGRSRQQRRLLAGARGGAARGQHVRRGRAPRAVPRRRRPAPLPW